MNIIQNAIFPRSGGNQTKLEAPELSKHCSCGAEGNKTLSFSDFSIKLFNHFPIRTNLFTVFQTVRDKLMIFETRIYRHQ